MTENEHKNITIAAVGDNCMDVYDATGEAYPGGNPLNVAVYFARLGGKASYTGVVGADKYGKQMRVAIAAKGVDVSHLRTESGATAVTHVSVVDGDRILGDYDEGVMAGFSLTKEDIAFLCQHDLVASGIWGMIERDLPAIKASGTRTAFDFADKIEHPVIDAAIPYVDYAFFSRDDEADAKLEQFLRDVVARGPKVAVVTLGKQGSMAYDGERFYRQGIVECEVVDTMGAGDSFIAGFLYGMLAGYDIQRCMALGAQNSSVTIQYKGAW